MNEKHVMNDFMVEAFHIIMKEEEACIAKRFENLSVKEMHVIDAVCRAVDENSDNRSTVIASTLRVTAGTLTTAVNSLERKGYLERKRDENDRRVVRIVPTPLGREAFKFHMMFHSQLVEQVLNILSEEEVTSFARGLSCISGYFKKK